MISGVSAPDVYLKSPKRSAVFLLSRSGWVQLPGFGPDKDLRQGLFRDLGDCR